MQHMTHMTVCMSKLQVQPAMNLQTVEKTIKVKQRTSPHNVRCTCTLTINVRQTTNRQLQGTRLFQRRPKHFKQIGLQWQWQWNQLSANLKSCIDIVRIHK